MEGIRMNREIDTMNRLSGWQPDQLAGWKVGDLADIGTLGRVQVARLAPPSEVIVRTKDGASARVGWRALRRVRAGETRR